MRGIRPKEGAYFASNLHSFVNPQPLQCLNIKDSVIEFALGTLVSVNTLSLPKHLSSHKDSPFPRAASREILNRVEKVGVDLLREIVRGKRPTNSLGEDLNRLGAMMPPV